MFSCAQTTRDLLFFVAQPLRFAAKAGAFSCAFEPGRTHRGALTKNPHPVLKCGKGGLHDFGVFLLAVSRNSGVLESGDKASAFAFARAPHVVFTCGSALVFTDWMTLSAPSSE